MKKVNVLKTVTVVAALLLTGCGSQGSASGDAQAFPQAGSTAEWVVPSAAGAGSDTLARIVSPAMQEDLGINIKVVNKEGGGQIIGLNALANSKPDGLTFGTTNVPSILGRYLDPNKKAGFDRESFTPIGSYATNAIVIGAKKDSPYQSIEELFDAVKAAPGTIKAGTDSRGGDDHINLLILEKELGLDFNIVHYNSGADKVASLVSGELDFSLGGVSSFYGQYKSGDLNLLAAISAEPSTFIPDVPTLESAGYSIDPMASTFVLSVPSKTPAEVVSQLEASLKKATENAEVQDKLKKSATQPAWMSSSEVSELWEERETAVKPIIEELLQEK